MTEEQKQYSKEQYYRINSNWDCMFAVICNDMDIVDQELMEHAIKILSNRHSLIITGNGGQGKIGRAHV